MRIWFSPPYSAQFNDTAVFLTNADNNIDARSAYLAGLNSIQISVIDLAG
jgi:hypothetical protein